jgi:Tautomerase enzyme
VLCKGAEALPILHVTALPQPGVDVDRVLATLCGAVAEELGEEPRATWGTWQTAAYAEGGDLREQQPRDTHPPVVRVVAFEGRSPELVARVLERAAAVLVRELRLEEGNAFVLWDEVRSGRVYTGGAVR